MWPFKKKQPKPSPTVHVWKIPAEHQIKFCELYDSMMNGTDSHRLQCLLFWRFATSILPQEWGPLQGQMRVQFDDNFPCLKFTEKTNP